MTEFLFKNIQFKTMQKGYVEVVKCFKIQFCDSFILLRM